MSEAPPRSTLLLVDDVPDNIDILGRILSPHYRTRVAPGGERALKIAATPPHPDLILLDVRMPDIDGHEVCRRLKARPETRDIPVIFVTALNETEDEAYGLALGAVDYITKPVSPAIVLARVRTHLALYDQNRELARQIHARTLDLLNTRQQIIHRLGRAAEFRDGETGNHIIRMSHYCRLIGEAVGLDEKVVQTLYHASPMHDIGKIGIRDTVLLKNGPLNEEEWAMMMCHPEIGAEIIGTHSDELLAAAREIALCHHEHWDGSGYPRGLAGEEIPLLARIATIADVFDALLTGRPYKPTWSVEDAVAYIEAGAGSRFDPGLIEPFRRALPRMIRIRERFADSHGKLDDTEAGPHIPI
ncbi:response regulator [Thauera butanivorans]|jgi:putative two-component system response regulator|uniref:response regulator n=1 Tax=Thauera butanivorans TaxID=86174 RepID=UPI0008385C4B|nr:two-component system response regulator [Thauera butanivorans]